MFSRAYGRRHGFPRQKRTLIRSAGGGSSRTGRGASAAARIVARIAAAAVAFGSRNAACAGSRRLPRHTCSMRSPVGSSVAVFPVLANTLVRSSVSSARCTSRSSRPGTTSLRRRRWPARHRCRLLGRPLDDPFFPVGSRRAVDAPHYPRGREVTSDAHHQPPRVRRASDAPSPWARVAHPVRARGRGKPGSNAGRDAASALPRARRYGLVPITGRADVGRRIR